MCKGKPSRIDYIVYHKPGEAAKLLEQNGYQAPHKKAELCKSIRLLIRRKGEPVIKQLIQIHPDKNIILETGGHNPDESGFCGCQSAYTGELKEYLNALSKLSIDQLNKLYEQAKQAAKEKPADKTLMGEVDAIWDALKRKKERENEKDTQQQQSTEKFLLSLALAFLAGLVIAKVA